MAKKKILMMILMMACTAAVAGLGIALKARGGKGTGDGAGDEKASCLTKTGIIGAMDTEVASLKEAMEDAKVTTYAGMEFCEGRLDGKDAVVVKCNIGKVNAGICAQLLISEFGVNRIINTGVAGSLDARIDIGDIVVSTDVVQHDYDLTPIGAKPGEFMDFGVVAFTADARMQKAALEAVGKAAPDVSALEGRVCTGDQFVASKEQKDRITECFGGLCCEMEGGAIAQVCYLNDTPFVVIRAISDKADGSAEVAFTDFMDEAARNCAAITRYMVAHLD